MTKKVIAFVGAAILSLTLFAGTALADTGTGSRPIPLPPVSTTDGAFMQELQGYVDQIMQLRIQTADLEAKLKAQHDANHALAQQVKQAIVGPLADQAKALKAQVKQAEEQLAPLKSQLKDLETQFKAAREAKDREKAQALAAQIKDLRAQAKAEWDALAPLRAQVKAIEEQIKAKAGDRQALKDQIAPLEQQQKDLSAQIEQLRTTKEAAWKSYAAALKADDHAGMVSALTSVIELKKQINGDLQQKLGIKQQIGTVLQAALTTYGGSAPAPAPAAN